MPLVENPGEPQGSPYIPADHIYEKLPDGRVIQVATKGIALPWAEALRLGLVKAPKAAEAPVETKALEAPAPDLQMGTPHVNTAPAPPAPMGAERMAGPVEPTPANPGAPNTPAAPAADASAGGKK